MAEKSRFGELYFTAEIQEFNGQCLPETTQQNTECYNYFNFVGFHTKPLKRLVNVKKKATAC